MTRRALPPTTPLGKALRELRNDAGMGSLRAAELAGISQPTLSRYERGERVPAPVTVKRLCHVYQATDETCRELVSLAEATHGGNVAADVVTKRGGWQMQERVAKVEQAAETISAWNPSFVDGDCQIRAYARALFRAGYMSEKDIERTVEARMARQELLYSGRSFRIVHTEGALMWCMGSPEIMVEQMDRLIELSKLPNVHLGVVPHTTRARVAPMHAFAIYDQSSVSFGTGHMTMFVAEHAHVKRYLEFWAEYEQLASWGDEARAVFARVRDLYARA